LWPFQLSLFRTWRRRGECHPVSSSPPPTALPGTGSALPASTLVDREKDKRTDMLFEIPTVLKKRERERREEESFGILSHFCGCLKGTF